MTTQEDYDALSDAITRMMSVGGSLLSIGQKARAALAKITVDPVRSLAVGVAYGSNSDVAPLEKRAGVTLGCHRTYWDLGEAGALATAKADLAAGRIPVLSFKLPGVTWAQAASGSVDTACKQLAASLSALGGRVIVAIHHEPEGDGDIANWTAMQEHLAPLFDVPGVEFWCIVTGWDEFFGDGTYSLDKIIPPGPVKGLGVDVYQSYKAQGDKWTDLDTAYWSKCQAFAQARGISWGVCETGLSDPGFALHPEWFDTQYDSLTARGAELFCYYDTGLNSSSSWVLTAGSAKEAAFLKVASK